MGYSKEESMKILTDVYEEHGEITADALDSSDVPVTVVYDSFDSMRHAEMRVGGDELDCGKCGRTFDTKAGLSTHIRHGSHTFKERLQRAEDMVGEYDSKHVVYVMKIERPSDAQEFFYVGRTTRPYRRVADHMSVTSEMSMPTRDGVLEKQKYEVLEVVITLEYEDERRAAAMERRMYLETAIENNTTRVLGGK